MTTLPTTLDSGTVNAGMTRIIVYSVILLCIVYDCIAYARGWQSISAALRKLDYQTDTLLRWLLLGVWLHLYCPAWWAK